MECKKCGKTLVGKQTSFCSEYCRKLYLKSQYRKRNREKINAYNREHNKNGIRGNPCTNNILKTFALNNPTCAKCGSLYDIHVCHIKPRNKGGKNKDNLISLCRKHHHEFDTLLNKFWG